MKLCFVETRAFTADIAAMGADLALRRLQQELQDDPCKGVVIRGSGGIRKVRMEDSARNQGKRGGIRVMYLYVPEIACTYFLAAFSKDEKVDLDARDLRELRVVAECAREELLRSKRYRSRGAHES